MDNRTNAHGTSKPYEGSRLRGRHPAQERSADAAGGAIATTTPRPEAYAPKKAAPKGDAKQLNQDVKKKPVAQKPAAMRQMPAKAQTRKASGSRTPQLRVIPLGGLDAIGKNMTVFECGGDMIVVDAGLMFPEDDNLGIDLVLPDYTYILENADHLRGIVITHGHEDHTGALPYLVKDLGRTVPIYGTPLTLGLIGGKFDEHKIMNRKFIELNARDTVDLGCFNITAFAVNHSIPGSLGLFIRTPAGTVLHTGDFKLDQTPIDGIHTDYESISHFGHTGVDLMLSDSTNAERTEFTKSEAAVGVVLNDIIRNAHRRVIVASFSSHIHRIQQVCDAAIAANRKIVVTGRSMITNTTIARDLGYLKVPDDAIVDAYEAKDIPPEKVVVLCTGSQGEPLSALARMSNGEHRTIEIEEGDTVIISATPVPGNEKAVTRVINGLSKIGADVYDKRRALVHVSGHAAAEELKIMLTMVSPRYFMPVHGEAAHLRAHAGLAQAVGVPKDHIFILENGDTLTMENHEVSLGEPVENGVVYVDGLSVGDTNQVVLRDRQLLASDGIATVVVMLDSRTHLPVGDIELIMRGVTGADEKVLSDDAHECVKQALSKATGAYGASTEMVQREVREALAKLLWDRCRRRPMIIPVVMEV